METKLGGWAAASMFVLSLSGYVVQSQFAQHVQADLGYRQPYFLFYVAHSSFCIIIPLHLSLLKCITRTPAKLYIEGLLGAASNHLRSRTFEVHAKHHAFPTAKFLKLIGLLTAGVTIPSVLWYSSVSLTSISDVTAMFNTNAMWTYCLTVFIAGARWQTRRLIAVLISVLGVFFIVYGGSSHSDSRDEHPITSNNVIGDLLALIASVTYAMYQVLYKQYAALSVDDPEESVLSHAYERIDGDRSSHFDPPSPTTTTRGTSSLPSATVPSRSRAISSASHASFLNIPSEEDALAPIAPTFGLYPNFITSCIGLCSLLFLWIPLPFLHYSGIEPFRLPPDWKTFGSVAAVALCGVAYNTGFMILLALWGPVLAAVGNLLTIVLVIASDAVFGHARESVTLPGLAGAGMIVCAFGVLVFETMVDERKRRAQLHNVEEEEDP